MEKDKENNKQEIKDNNQETRAPDEGYELLNDFPYYGIFHKKTKKLYINHNRQSFIFKDHTEAQKKIYETDENLYSEIINLPKKTTIDDYINNLYESGISSILYIKKDKTTQEIKLISYYKLKKKFTNPAAEMVKTRVQQHLGKTTLQAFYNIKFIVPSKIVTEKDIQKIEYLLINNKETNNEYLPIFTTLDNYNKWNKKTGQELEPLLIPMKIIKRISGIDGIIININTSDPLYLNKKLLDYIRKEKKYAD